MKPFTLVLSATGPPAVISVDFAPVGRCQSMRILSDGGEHYIGWHPLEPVCGYTAMLIPITPAEEVPVPAGAPVRCHVWQEGIIEIEIFPRRIVPMPKAFEVKQIRGVREWAVLYDNGALAIEDSDGRTVYRHEPTSALKPLGLLLPSHDLICSRCIADDGSQRLTAIARKTEGYVTVLDEAAHEFRTLSDNRIVGVTERGDGTGRAIEKVYKLSGGVHVERTTRLRNEGPAEPANAKEAARHFAEALLAGADIEAEALLSAGARETGLAGIKEFLGDFTCIREPEYFTAATPATLMLGYAASPEVITLRPYHFETMQGYKIDNISEL